MSCKTEIMLTERDLKVPELVKDYKYLTTTQLWTLLYPSKQKAQTRLKKVWKCGLVKRFAYPVLVVEGGRGEYVYHLCDLPKMSFSKLEHTIKLNDIRIAFVKACQESRKIKLVGFIPEYKKKAIGKAATRDSGYSRTEKKSGIQPDGILCLENQDSKKRALFFIELDLGTERIKTSRPGVYSFLEKLLVYKEWMLNQNWKEWDQKFQYSFSGFRVLVVMNRKTRIQKLRNELTKLGIKKFIYLAEGAKIQTESVFGRVWHRCDFSDNEMYSIVE